MADTLDRIQKLIALAMNNPDLEESRSAARMAVAMIVEHNITLEGKDAMQFELGSTRKTWKPDDEFEKFWQESGAGTHTDSVDPDLYEGRASGGQGLKAAVVDTDLDDDFMHKMIIKAWRSIRAHRKILEGEIYRYEMETGRKYPK